MTRGQIPETGVIVVGSGAAALAAALAAHDAGATVTVVERAEALGGTTAVSGGGVWMPGNHVTGADDSGEDALAYMTALSRGRAPAEQLARYVAEGPGIVAGLERRSGVRFAPIAWPDYHPEMEGARATGRMIEPDLYDTSRLGDWAKALRRAPVLGLPLTLQESTVDWTPVVHARAVRRGRDQAAGPGAAGRLRAGPRRRPPRGLPGTRHRARPRRPRR